MLLSSPLLRHFKKRPREPKDKQPSASAGSDEGDDSSDSGHSLSSATLLGESSTAPSRSKKGFRLLGFFNKARNSQFSFTPFVGGESAMAELRLRTDPNAAVDSSARQPPPTCHPKTRRQIRKKLALLFDDERREYRMVWLFGAAGTGKSAVGQTFSMKCLRKRRLGAAFFFSRPNRRNKYGTVIPTLAYQLATHCLPYRAALIARVDYDAQIFDKAPPVQLIKLIVEPLLEVRSRITTTYLMLLDGVDECGENMDDDYEREREQCELIEMIANIVRDHPDLPLFWLLCSRPEHHLQKSYTSISEICRREELVIDTKCRKEVEGVLREGFENIAKKRDVISQGPGGWPSKAEFDTVERAVCGLHVFGAAILRDIGSSSDPVEQLKSLIPFLEHIAGADSTRSIEDMDKFYMRILNDVPPKDLPITLNIVGTLITMDEPEVLSAQALCNFLHLEPNRFFSALRKLHSVIDIPSREAAEDTSLQVYHASFSDFLTDASRSKEFFIAQSKVMVDITKLCLLWHELDSNLFHSSDLPLIDVNDSGHDHEPLPQVHLKWIASPQSHWAISKSICYYAEKYCFPFFKIYPRKCDEELLSVACNLDLRHMSSPIWSNVIAFFNWVYNQDPISGFIRTVPETYQDRILLTYLEVVTKGPIPPARFPLTWRSRSDPHREYVLVGRGLKSIVVWATEASKRFNMMALNLDREPDEHTIERYEISNGYKDWRQCTQRSEAE